MYEKLLSCELDDRFKMECLVRVRLVTCLIGFLANSTTSSAAPDPDIVLIMADDMGYGDPQCYHAKLRCAPLNRLAVEGMMFTDAHAAGAVCVPSRRWYVTERVVQIVMVTMASHL